MSVTAPAIDTMPVRPVRASRFDSTWLLWIAIIAVLLFLVGIKLDVKLIRSLGVVSVMTGLGQVIFTAFFGFVGYVLIKFGLEPAPMLLGFVGLLIATWWRFVLQWRSDGVASAASESV